MPSEGTATGSRPRPTEGLAAVRGMMRGDLFAPEASTVWNLYRRAGGLGTMVVCVFLAVLWGWPGGWAVGAIAAAVAIDAEMRRRRHTTRSLLQSVVVDVTFIGAAITMIDLEPAGIGAPYVYMMSIALLLLPVSQAIPVGLYATAWALAAFFTETLFPLPPGVDRSVLTVVAYLVFTVLLLAMIAVLARSLAKSRRFAGERLKADGALVMAAQQLLTQTEGDALTEALEAIREATGARAAFVAENSGGPKEGPAALVTQVGDAGESIADSISFKWTLPYLQHREAAASLAKGDPVRLDEALAGVMGGDPASVHAVAVPISVGGEWAGFLGLAYDTGDEPAPKPDMHVLETVGAMMGAFLERREAYQRLEQMVRSKDQFLASVSHEIRTPLTSVLGFASVLREDPGQLTTDDGREIVELIGNQAQEVSDLVEDLLVAARAEIDAVSVVKEPVVLADEIKQVLAARLGTEQGDIFVAASPMHRALADPTRVRQIIRNLLTNALRYGGDQITITTHRDGPEVTMVFSDNGEGVPPEYRRRIFDPYYRGKPGLAKPESIGLGLAVSLQLARLMDGDLMLRSDLSPATFQLTLPAAPKDPELDGPSHPEGAIIVGREVHVNLATSD